MTSLRIFCLSLTSAALFASPAMAQDGKTLYTTYCSACHGTDGVGPKGNVNPPLAKSEWHLGKPDRAIAAVLKGLTGPIEVNGKLYNLAMPPQGAVLSDEQLASILSYVRTSFGNVRKGTKPKDIAKRHVKATDVTKVRKALEKRALPFTAAEIRRNYPIPFSRGWPRLRNVISHSYEGKWEEMPDFSQLKVTAFEEEPRNLVDVYHSTKQKEFGLVWTGEIVTSKEGDYNATLNASDGATLYIEGKKIVSVEGVGPMGAERTRIHRFRMKKGANKFRLEYFNNQGNPGLVWRMQGPTGSHYMSESRLKTQPTPPPIPLIAEKGSAILYRNFIKGARPRSIGVGYDGGVNQAFGIRDLGPDLIWQGEFIDGGRHWTGRGSGYEAPAGKDVVQLINGPGYAVLEQANANWPERKKNPLSTRFLGYSLDDKDLPTFNYQVGNFTISEHSSIKLVEGKRQLVRQLSFTSKSDAPGGFALNLASGPSISREGAETIKNPAYRIGGVVSAQVSSDNGLTPLMRKNRGKDQLILPLPLKAGTSTLTVTYTWN